jgi:TP901 family phage tail tape measure protein
MAERTVSVGIRMQMAGAITAVRNYRKAWIDARDELQKNVLAHREATTQLANTAALAGAALLAGVGMAVAKFAEFDAQMSNVNAVMRETDENMERLREAALAAGKATSYSATEAGQAIEELGKAGISTEDILSGGLDGALSLAAAGAMVVADAAEIAALAMQQFGLSGSEIPHVADLLAAAAGKSLGSVHDLGMALQQSGLVANQFGLSIEDTTGALAAFASAGLIGSDAGTSLKTMLTMLANPSKESAELMKQIGINAYDASGRFVGLTDLAGQLKTQMGGLTQAQRDQALAQIFGTDALRAANVLYEEGSSGIRDWTMAVNDSGYASEVAAERMDNLKGDLDKLQSTIETSLVETGSGANTVLRTLVQTLTEMVETFSSLPGPVQTTVLAIAAVAGAGLLTAGGLARLVIGIAETRESLKELEKSGSRANRAMVRMARGAGIASVALGALAAANAVTAKTVTYDLDELTATIEKFGNSGESTGQMARLWGADLERLANDVNVLEQSWHDVTGTAIAAGVEWATLADSWSEDTVSQAKDRIQGLDQALTDLVEQGKTQEAAAVFERIAEVAAEEGVKIDELIAGLPMYQAALEGAARKTEEASTATQLYAYDLGISATAAEDATAANREFDAALQALRDTMFGSKDAQAALTLEIERATEAFDENGNSLNVNSEAGALNHQAVMGLIQANHDLIAAEAESGATAEELAATTDDLRADFIELMKQAGFSEEAIDDYAAAFDDIPASKTTVLIQELKTVGQWNVPSSGILPQYADGGYIPGFANGGIPGFPSGGMFRGRGGPRDDANIIAVSDGEFIVNAEATSRYRALLEMINSNRGIKAWKTMDRNSGASQSMFGMGASHSMVRVSFDFTGVGDDFARAIKNTVRIDGDGIVQNAFGTR